MKDTFYFSHDYNARNDWKLVKIMMKHWLVGIGAYWCIVEMLYEEWWYIEKDYDLLSYELRCDLLLIKSIVEDYWLFKYSDESIYSESVIGRLAKRAEKSEKAKKNIMERWGKNENRKIADNTIFYVIEVSHEDESFIKCWITSESISRRYSWKLWPYTYSILHQEDVELEIALWREREVAKIANSYIPFEKFWWYLECYSIDDKEKILDFVLQREYKGNTIKERKEKERKEKKKKPETEIFVGEKQSLSIQTVSEKTPLEKKLDEFLVFRKAIKKQIVPASLEAFIRKLRDMSQADEAIAIQILDNSIANGWQGIFPIDVPTTMRQSKNSISKVTF